MVTVDDAALIERTLERLAEAVDDITPLVYETFFAARPDVEQLFVDKYDMSLGHMLNEVFMTLIDQANGKSYVNDLLQTQVSDHDSWGVKHMEMYRDYLGALQATIDKVLGGDWPEQERAAFQRQCEGMYRQLLLAQKRLVERKVIAGGGEDLSGGS